MTPADETSVLALDGGHFVLRHPLSSDRAVVHANEGDARAWLRRGSSASIDQVLRRVLVTLGPNALSLRAPAEVMTGVARALALGRVRAVVGQTALPAGVIEPEVATSSAVRAELTTLEFQVFWDHADEAIANVALRVELPNGEARSVQTDGTGKVTVTGVPRGTCTVTSDLGGARRGDTLHVVGVSDHPIGDAGAPPKQGKPPPRYRLAQVTRHRVRTGESLDSIAKRNKTTWRALAEFNWNTCSPREIDERLRVEVGCTKKTADGKNYVFDDADHPGIVLVPTAWKASFATGDLQTVRVLQHRFVYVLTDQHRRFPLPHHEYLLYDGDRHVLTGESDEEGRVMLDDVPARWHVDVIGPGPSHPFWDASAIPRAEAPEPPEEHAFEDDDLYDALEDHG